VVRTTFDISTDGVVNVKNVLVLTYGKETTTFESDVGGVTTGLYFFRFVLDLPMGLPLGPVVAKSEILILSPEGEWKTLDLWEGELVRVTYKLLGQILRVGRRVDKALTPLPFSVPLGEKFLLGADGIIQVPEPGNMTLGVEIYTPLGEVIPFRVVEEIAQPAALTWTINLEMGEFRVPGIYSGRIGLSFDEAILHTVEGRLFEVTMPPPLLAPTPMSPIIGLAGLVILLVPLTMAIIATIKGVS